MKGRLIVRESGWSGCRHGRRRTRGMEASPRGCAWAGRNGASRSPDPAIGAALRRSGRCCSPRRARMPPPVRRSRTSRSAIPHVNYQGVQHLTYCYGPITISPGQNIIRFNATNLFPQQPGLHHQVRPRARLPERHRSPRRRAPPAPRGLGRQRQPAVRERRGEDDRPDAEGIRLADQARRQLARSTTCSTTWSARPRQVYIVWRVDFVPDTSPAAATIKHGAHQVDERRRADARGTGSRARSTRSSTP